MSSTFRINVVIVGAGLGGLAAAIGISQAGHHVTVIERAPQLGEIGAGIQIPPNLSRILDRWGVLPSLSVKGIYPESIIIRSYCDDSILSRLKLKGSMEKIYGTPWLHVHRATLHKALSDEAARQGVVFRLGLTVTGIDFQTPAARIQDNMDMAADIIIGADGVNSVCRDALLGHPDPPVPSGDMVYRISLPTTLMKKHKDLGVLATKPDFNYWAGPSGHAVGYLIEHGTQFNIVITAADNLPSSFSRGTGDVQEMRERFKGWSNTFLQLLEMASETTMWKLCCGREMEAWRHRDGKFALLGDACHAMLPYLAQGAAQAVEDGAVLGGLFSKCESKDEVFDALGIYEELRIPRAKLIARLSKERDGLVLGKPGEECLSPWADPVFQKELFGYDVVEEVEKNWWTYKAGKAGLLERSER